jgi:transcriptional regulator with XRE-family HTH domain
MPKLLVIFARNLKHYRTQREFTQEELAEKAGLHRTYIGAIERCERNISIRNIEKIAAALKISPATLLSENRSDG